MLGEMMKNFSEPTSEYRAKPFWAWNGKMQPEEVRRQIRVMKRMGLGGFFMHSRVGLDTPYLAEEWFECVGACIDEAKKLDMQAWLYDEDRWPSGAAGGLVTKDPQHRHKYLSIEIIDKPVVVKDEDGFIAVFTATIDGVKVKNVSRQQCGSITPGKGEKILLFRQKTSGCFSWYNGYTYLDVMSEDAVAAFIKCTHEKYCKRYGEDFGKAVPGVFMDEPNHGSYFSGTQHMCHNDGIPWTPKLPEVFKARYGYDIIDRIVEVFFDVTDVDECGITPARHDYHDCTTHLFCTAFAKQLYDWCEKYGLDLTGHLLFEDTLYHQAQAVGSCLRFYEYMQAPGMDLLTQHWTVFNTARQVSSAAHQFNRPRRLTETYGCTGWDFEFAGHKTLGDWQAAMGINLRCQHLSWYTMLGEAKRDYPASIFYQSPWWQQYTAVEDYFARINAVMANGVERRDLLVLHPIESAWLLVKHGWNKNYSGYTDESLELDRKFKKLTHSLDAVNVGFDFGDEEMIARLAKISSGQICIGHAAYKAILIPPMITMRSSTLELLKKFQAAGGEVIFTGPAPEYVDAVKSDDAAKFAEECLTIDASLKNIEQAVGKYRIVSISDDKGNEILTSLHLLREDADAFYLFVCNTSADYLPDSKGDCEMSKLKAVQRKLAYGPVVIKGFNGCEGKPIELNPLDGTMVAADAKKSRDRWCIKTSLPALASRLFVIPKDKKSPIAAKAAKPLKTVSSRKIGGEKWAYVLSENNALVLDTPRFRIDGGKWLKPLEILRLDHKVRDAMNIKHRGGEMVQPWAQVKNPNPATKRVELEYEFNIKTLPSSELSFAIEMPSLYRVFVNGTEIDRTCESGWWVDLSLRRLPVDPSLLHVGVNVIRLETDYNENHPGFEIVYLLGNFGVSVKGTKSTITALPEKLKLGTWTNQGLAFYSGNVGYCTTVNKPAAGKKAFIKIGEYKGVAVEVLVNGKSAGVVGWGAGDEAEITKLLTLPKNEVTIKILGHRRNSHGPLHLAKENTWVGPNSFLSEGELWSDAYVLKNIGMMEAPTLKICE